MAPEKYTVQVEGRIFWKLVFEYDNTDNSGEIRQEISTDIVKSYKSSTFREDVSKVTHSYLEKIGVSTEAGASYGPVSAKVSASYENSKEINDLMETTTRSQTETTVESKVTIKRSYTVGPHSKLSLFQQYFSSPGVELAADVFSTKPGKDQESTAVNIEVVVQATEFIENIQVIYGDHPANAPEGRVREIAGKSDDINAGFKGKYVWLSPVYTTNSEKAATSFDVIIQGSWREGWLDLAKDAGGDYRYLVAVHDQRDSKKITELTLFRTSEWIDGQKPTERIKGWGYDGTTGDINKDRGGEFLHLIWKSKRAY